MRIISGRLGGRNFESPHGYRTHPMSEKVRGALFGTLGDISGLTVLDPFAGSGALSIEAISRGAKHAIAIDADKRAAMVLTANVEQLGLDEQIKPIRAFAGSWSTRHQDELFDVVLLDPPYDHIPYRDLSRMPRHLTPDGILVLSWPGKAETFPFVGLKEIQVNDYGDAQLIFYRRV